MMHAIHPVSSPILWLRVLAALVLVVIVPGYLLAGRHVPGGRIARLIASTSAGLLGLSLAGRGLDLVGLALHPWTVPPLVAAAGLVLGRWPAWRAAWAQVFAPLRPAATRETQLLTGVAACWWLVLLLGFGDFVVPPTVDDATNHAFMVSRIAESATVDPDQVMAAPLGSLRVGYLTGWHLTAALVARTSGVAPYAATWLLVLALLALLPLALSLLWRALRVPSSLVVLGAAWLLTDAFMPSGILGWGGFGQLIGMFLVPVPSLLVAAALRERSPLVAVVAGTALGVMIHVHASEVVVILGLGLLLFLGGDRVAAKPQRRAAWLAAVLGVLALVVAAGPEVWSLALAYQDRVVPGAGDERRAFADALRRLLGSAGGPDQRHAAVLLGIGFGLVDRRLRALAMVSLALGLFYLALAVLRDPVSQALASPFYAQAPRILYLQAYVLPPLLGLPLVALWRARERPRWRWPAGVLAVLLAVAWFGPGLHKTVRDLRSHRDLGPFTEASYEHAIAMADVVGPGELIANRARDGGAWAVQISGVAGVFPHGWDRYLADGRSLHDLVRGLASDPWPDDVSILREAGVAYLYVNDITGGAMHRADLDADPRFQPVLAGARATLYRIRWPGR